MFDELQLGRGRGANLNYGAHAHVGKRASYSCLGPSPHWWSQLLSFILKGKLPLPQLQCKKQILQMRRNKLCVRFNLILRGRIPKMLLTLGNGKRNLRSMLHGLIFGFKTSSNNNKAISTENYEHSFKLNISVSSKTNPTAHHSFLLFAKCQP